MLSASISPSHFQIWMKCHTREQVTAQGWTYEQPCPTPPPVGRSSANEKSEAGETKKKPLPLTLRIPTLKWDFFQQLFQKNTAGEVGMSAEPLPSPCQASCKTGQYNHTSRHFPACLHGFHFSILPHRPHLLLPK